MSISREDVLIKRACRVLLRDNRYTEPRSRALIRWLGSNWAPTSDIAARTLVKLGPKAFDDLLVDVLNGDRLPLPNAVWALELFSDQHDRLLPHVRKWLTKSKGELQMQSAVTIAHILTKRLKNRQKIDTADVELFRSVLTPKAISSAAIRVHLRDFERATREAEG